MFDPTNEQMTEWYNEVTTALLATLLARNKEIPETLALFALLSLALSSLEAANMDEEAKERFFNVAREQGDNLFKEAQEAALFSD